MLATLLATAAVVTGPPGWSPDTTAAWAWAQGRRGEVTFAVRTPNRVWGRGMDRVAPSASTLKALLLVTYLRDARGRALTKRDRALLSPMVRRSANEPASALVVRLGQGRIESVARRAGMRAFHLRSPWGNSEVTARDLTRFALRMRTLMPSRHRDYGMALMRSIVPSQRWGIARHPPTGWVLYFKSGWGSGTGRVDNQVALLERGDEQVAVAILTTSQGDHAYGRRTLEGVARRLLRELPA